MLCNINKTQEKAVTGYIFWIKQILLLDFLILCLYTWSHLESFIPDNKVFPKKLIPANNSSIAIYLIDPLTHTFLHTYAGNQASISS